MPHLVCHQTPFYKKAKAIRLGHENLPGTHLEIINWIQTKFGVATYYFDFRKEGEKILVDIIVDQQSDGPRIGYVNRELSGVLNEFMQKNQMPFEISPGATAELCFDTFERISTEEILDAIKQNEIKKMPSLFQSIADIHDGPRSFSIFYHTQEQFINGAQDGTNQAICNYIYQSIKKYDQFNYCKPDTISIHFDSIENLDTNYNGEWQNYYR